MIWDFPAFTISWIIFFLCFFLQSPPSKKLKRSEDADGQPQDPVGQKTNDAVLPTSVVGEKHLCAVFEKGWCTIYCFILLNCIVVIIKCSVFVKCCQLKK